MLQEQINSVCYEQKHDFDAFNFRNISEKFVVVIDGDFLRNFPSINVLNLKSENLMIKKHISCFRDEN